MGVLLSESRGKLWSRHSRQSRPSNCVARATRKEQTPQAIPVQRVAVGILATGLTLCALDAPWATTEAYAEFGSSSPGEERAAAIERRKELLRAAKERVTQGDSVEGGLEPQVAPETASVAKTRLEMLAESVKKQQETYDEQISKSQKSLPRPREQSSFSFPGFPKFSAPEGKKLAESGESTGLSLPKFSAPSLPKPSMPEMPKLSVPELPKAPSLPKLLKPEVPKPSGEGSKGPSLPKFSAPELPKPSMPELPKISAPELPKFKAPELPKAPSVDLPKFSAPELPKAPKVELPKISPPEIPKPKLPKFEAPELPKAPKIEVPKFKAPDLPKPKLPQFKAPELPKAPKVELPKFSVPELPKPALPKAPALPQFKAPEPPKAPVPVIPPPPPAKTEAAPNVTIPEKPAPMEPPAKTDEEPTTFKDFMEKYGTPQPKAKEEPKPVIPPTFPRGDSAVDMMRRKYTAEPSTPLPQRQPPRPAPVEPQKAPKAVKERRKGPLPLWLTQVLMLGVFGGLIYCLTVLYDTTSKAVLTAYDATDRFLLGLQLSINRTKKDKKE